MPKVLHNRWAQDAHLLFLDAIMQESKWRCDQIAFHGGTSLHLSWQSARFSEDLDFLLDSSLSDFGKVLDKAFKHIKNRFSALHPGVKLEMLSKTKDDSRMEVAQINMQHENYMGKVVVKAEFWKVDADYLKNYPVVFRTPMALDDLYAKVSNPIPAGTLKAAFCDKLTALATRPYLKWRDIYDMWWINTQKAQEVSDLEGVAKQFLHNVSAYKTIDGLSPGDALRKFLENDKDEIFAKAEKDLKNWLPEALWDRLYPVEVKNMIDYVYNTISEVSDTLDNLNITDNNDAHDEFEPS